MLTKVTLQQARALRILSQQPQWLEVESLLQQELTEALDRLMLNHDPVAMQKLAGRAQALKDLMKLVKDAPDLMRRLDKTS